MVQRLAARWLLIASVLGAKCVAAERWEQMDYGPFLSSSVTLPWARDPEALDGLVLKGVTVKLGTNAAACFDTAELRWAGVWVGGWLKLYGTPFDGTHRPPEKSRPLGVGTPIFGTSHGPGWAKGGDWRDPRVEPYVPLPSEWAKYQGLEVQGDQVTFRYTVGATEIRDTPALEAVGETPAFVRHLRVERHRQPLALLVAELRLELRNKVGHPGTQPSDDQRIAVLGNLTAAADQLPKGARWEVQQSTRLVLHLPPSSAPVTVRLAVARAKPAALRDWVPAVLVAARPVGKSAAPAPIVTQGKLGQSGQPYEVDLLTAPDENPAHSWLRFGGFDFFSNGRRAALATWNGDVWLVDGIDEKLERLEWRRFACGLFQPLGLKIVRDAVYVLGRDQITRLRDSDGDGWADHYDNFNNDVSITPNFHEFALDLHTDPAGNFYFNKGAPLLGTEYWDPTSAHNGCTLRVSRDGRKLERYATGLRAPNGLGVGPHGEVTSADNEGIWTPVCRLNWVKPGGFYGAVGMDHGAVAARGIPGWDAEDFTPRYPDPRYDPPLCWIPYAIDNSSGSQVWAQSTRFGPLSGALIHLSYGKCRAFEVLRQEVDGVMQGGVVPLPWRFEYSAARGRMNPADGQLYVCGLKGWQTSAARDGAFHRVRYTGRSFPTLIGFEATRSHFDLRFSTPLDRATVEDLGNWNLQWWNYKWSKSYGSDLYRISDPSQVVGRKGELKGEPVPVTQTRLSEDGRSVRLSVTATEVMQLMVKARLRTAAGEDLPLEYFGTLNRLDPRR